MIHEFWPVTSYAIRPAGKPDVCFYCHAKLGTEHNLGCVIRDRTVVIRVSFEIVYPVPEDWNPEQIEAQLNESGYCASNILNQLDDLENRVGCLCGFSNFEYVREATKEDEDKNKLFVSELAEGKDE